MNWIERNASPFILAILIVASAGLFFIGSNAQESQSSPDVAFEIAEAPHPESQEEQTVPAERSDVVLEDADFAEQLPEDSSSNVEAPQTLADTSPDDEVPATQAADGVLSRGEIETIVRDYIMENPEIIADALDKHMANRERLAELSAQKALKENWDELAFNDASYSVGSKDAPITVIEFFDYNCGYCREATPTLLEIAKKNKNVRVVFKEFPIRGEESFNIARASLAAIKQDKYFEIHRALMTSKGSLTMKRFERMAEDLDIDMARLRKDMNSSEIHQAIEQNHLLAESLNIDGTPAFIVGDEILRGWPGEDGFEQFIESVENAQKQG